MDLSINKGNRRNILAKNICPESDLKLSMDYTMEHIPPKPNVFNTDSNFNIYSDETFKMKIENLLDKNADLSISDLSKDERMMYERKKVLPNRLTINSATVPNYGKNITEIEVNTFVNENGTICKEQKYLSQALKQPVYHPYCGTLNNGIIIKNQNSSTSNAFNSNFNKNQGLNSGYRGNFDDKNALFLIKQKQLEAKAQELRIAEEKIIKQEEEAQIKSWQALQEQEAALLEKEKALKIREMEAQKTYEAAMKSIAKSRKQSTSTEKLSFTNESPKVNNHSPQINPNDIKRYISDNNNKRKFESVVPSVMVIKGISPHSTNGSLKHFINMPNGNTFYLHSSNQLSHAVEKEPPRKIKILDVYGMKPSINPSKILHTYSRATPKKFNSTNIKSEDGISHILPQHSNRLIMNHDRSNSSCKNIKEILISDNGTIKVSEFSNSLKYENSSRPPSTLSHSQFLRADNNLGIKLPIINGCFSNSNHNTTKIDIETNNDMINKTKVDIETTDISCNDMEVTFTEKVQKLTTGLQFRNQTTDISEEFSVFPDKKVHINELSENINDNNISKIWDDDSNEPCDLVENKMGNGLQDNSDVDFDVNESSCISNMDLYSNNDDDNNNSNNYNNDEENNNNNNNDNKKNNNNLNSNNHHSFSQAYTSICSETSSYDLNEITVDANFKDLVCKIENNSEQFNHTPEMDINDKLHIQNSKLNKTPETQNYNDICSKEDYKMHSTVIGVEQFSIPRQTGDNCHEENESHEYWNESCKNIKTGECSTQYSDVVALPIENITEQLVSKPQNIAGADCSYNVENNAQVECNYDENSQQLESIYDEKTGAINSLETSIDTATCNGLEDCSFESPERDHLNVSINNEEFNFGQIEGDTPSFVNELNIDDASIIDVNEINFDKASEDFQEEYSSDLNNLANEESDFEDVTSTLFKERDKSFQPLKWTLEFRQKHYSDKLYPELICYQMQWVEVDELEEQLFLSNSGASPLFTLKNNFSKDISWSRINCFSGKQLGSGKLMFVGGPIKCSAWCPVPFIKVSQYIALSTICNPDVEITLNKSESHRGLIQIWDCGKLNETDVPSLALCIAHEHGVVGSLTWCPSGIYEKVEANNDSALNRLGLLAAAFSDGLVRVYLIPHPYQIKRKKIILKKMPEFSLIHYDYENSDLQCVKICWSQYKGHSFIAGSFTNGMVCIWNLTCSSPVLRSSDTEGIKLYPINSFFAHNGICSTVSFYPKTNGQHIVTGGCDRTIKFWDLTETEHPLTVIKKGYVTDSIWIPHWSGAIFSFDDAFNNYKSSTIFRGNGFYGTSLKTIAGTNATIWSISASDWLNAIVQGDEAGEILFSYPKKLNSDNGSECHSSKHNFPLFSVRLERIKDLQSQDDDQCTKDEDSCRGKRRRGKKRGRKAKVTQYVDEPVTYSSAVETYGIKFLDDDNISKPNISCLRTKQNSEPMPAGPITGYPLMGASTVAWNNNLGTHTWIFIGLNSGFGRLIQLPSCKKL